MVQILVKLIGALITFLGVILIYDARIISKKFFGFGDQNQASQILKVSGLILAIIGGLILYCI